MKLLSSKNTKRYFLSSKLKVSTGLKVDLVLSPEFYWIRSFKIDVPSFKHAIKVLPILFEDIVDKNMVYEYYAIKQDEGIFLCFAYDNNEILKAIKNTGLLLSQVNYVYFAQIQMSKYEQFIIDDSTFIFEKDILIKVPSSLCENVQILSNKLHSNDSNKHRVKMKFYLNTFNLKYIYTLCSILLVISFFNILKYTFYSNEIKQIKNEIKQIRSKKQIPKTNLQFNSILKTIEEKHKKNIKFKKAFSYILKYNQNIKNISYINKKFIIDFNKIDEIKLKTYISKKYKIINLNSTRNSVKLEFEI